MQRARVLFVITLVIVFFALATGFPVFHRMYYVFGLLLVVGLLWTWLLVGGIEIDVRRPTLRSKAGQSIRERVIVRRRSQFLRGFLEIQEQTDMPIDAPGAVIGLEGREPEPIDLEVPCPQRGIFKLGPVAVAGSDPLGLYRLRRSSGPVQRLVVHPATIDLPGFVLLPADLPGEGPVHLRSQHVTNSAFSIRDYMSGDSLNRMAWKSTARFQKLMVKEFEMEPANNIWVVVDMARRANAGPAGRAIEETAITVAASIAKRYSDGGYPVGFFSYGNERFAIAPQRGPGHLIRIMDALAELRAQGSTRLLNVIADLHARAGRYTSVAIVTASQEDEWLDGVRHLLLRRSRITIVSVDGDPAAKSYPEVAHRIAGMGIPVYTVKAGTETTEGLVSLAPAALSHDGVARRARFAHASIP
ncbi:MAG: DUF58 domain-containing protein [Dehalococcoidia bacterium]